MSSLSDLRSLVEAFAREFPPFPELSPLPQGAAIASWIDYTLLKPEATEAQIRRLCEEAREYHFATVCVNPVYVALAAQELRASGVGVCAVVAFPLGAHTSRQKARETRQVLEDGASEVDMVIHIGALKAGEYERVLEEIAAVVEEAHAQRAIVKVILEMALLRREEKIWGCLLAQAAGADFVKTSTGFGPAGATVEDVELMRRVVGAKMGVKAAGGIRTWKDAQAMLRAGANRLGSSSGVAIVKEALQESP
ncbi:MAG: deoxyribose-phosphate aldolase [Anaerolineales bacterium]